MTKIVIIHVVTSISKCRCDVSLRPNTTHDTGKMYLYIKVLNSNDKLYCVLNIFNCFFFVRNSHIYIYISLKEITKF